MGPTPSNAKQIFLDALEIGAPDARRAYVESQCGGDAALLTQVEQLLAHHAAVAADARSFLESPPIGLEPGHTLDTTHVLETPPGTVIGRYKLLEALGEGGYGVVFMAEQSAPVHRRVALKIIKAGMDTRLVIARFEAERQALALMDHPNIAKVFDAGTTDSGRPYFVMELVKGVPITQYCDERRLTPQQRLGLFIDVCHAVQHAHQKGIIHRDLKPTNVLVAEYDGRPVPKVIDFGVAKAIGQQLTERTMFTAFGQVIGTIEYMSPEHARLNQLDIDTRSDVYSLGVILYELLTGQTPLDRERLQSAAFDEMLRIVREEEPVRPSTRLSGSRALASIAANRGLEPKKLAGVVHGELDWIVMKALEKDRNRRYETANGLAQDIGRYLLDERVEACPPSVGYRLRKFVRRNRRLFMTAAAFVLLLVASVVGLTIGIIAINQERARTSLANADLRREQQRASLALEAEQDARAAEARRRKQARDALGAMTSEMIDHLLVRQDALDAQHKAFLKNALSAYEDFAADTGQDEESRFGMAEAYYNVARIHGRLGSPDDCVNACRKTVALLEGLAADFPAKPQYRMQLAKSYEALGIGLESGDRLEEAEASYRRGIALQKEMIADSPADPDLRENLAGSYGSIGMLLRNTGRSRDAETAYRDAIDVQKQLILDFPKRRGYRQALAGTYNNLGVLLKNANQPEPSEAAFREAIALNRQLIAEKPQDAECRQELARDFTNLGNLLAQHDRTADAESAYLDARAAYKQLSAEYPAVPDYRVELARVSNNLGGMRTTLDQLHEAEPLLREAMALSRQLVADFADVPEYQHELARSGGNLAVLLSRTDQRPEAEALQRDTIEVYRRLLAGAPGIPAYHYELSLAMHNLANSLRAGGALQASRELLEQALQHSRVALDSDSRDPRYRSMTASNHRLLADCLLELGDHRAAATAAEHLAQGAADPSKDVYEAGRVIARCLPLAQKDEKLPEETRRESARDYASRATQLLRDAVQGGFKDIDQMKNDPALDPLRSDEEFKKLLADLEVKERK